ncbi:hypothetical protein JCM15765_12420 [Paradesulfitobacterium aromaticivorans]
MKVVYKCVITPKIYYDYLSSKYLIKVRENGRGSDRVLTTEHFYKMRGTDIGSQDLGILPV